MEPEILVLDRRDAAEPGPVERRLAARGAPYATLFLEEISRAEQSASFRIDARERGEVSCVDGRTGERFGTTRLRSVWAESLGLTENPLTFFHGEDDLTATLNALGEGESWILGVSILSFLAHRCLFLPQLMEKNRGNHSLYQQAAALQSGFLLVPTYAGAHAGRLFELLGAGSGEPLHYHPLTPLTFELRGRQFVSVDRFLEVDRAFTLSTLREPALFTRWPEHGRRLVVAFLGDEAWALDVRLRDPELDPDVTDLFYQLAQDNLRCEPVSLPSPLAGLCREFRRRTGLLTCTLDVLEETAGGGSYYFLSARTDSRFHLFEEAGVPIYDRLVDWLVEGPESAR